MNPLTSDELRSNDSWGNLIQRGLSLVKFDGCKKPEKGGVRITDLMHARIRHLPLDYQVFVLSYITNALGFATDIISERSEGEA